MLDIGLRVSVRVGLVLDIGLRVRVGVRHRAQG